MRGLVRFFIQLIVALLCFVAVTVAFIILDGLNDVGDGADVALVVGHGSYPGGSEPQLDRLAELYKENKFKKVIVSAANRGATTDELAAMTRYLEGHGVPSSAIIEDSGASDTGEIAHDVADVMNQDGLRSVMLVGEYYRMTRLKLALLHAGVSDIAKSHVGSARIGDAGPIVYEVYALYDYLIRTFLMPAAEKIKREATVEADKAKVEAEKAKETVNKNLDSLPK